MSYVSLQGEFFAAPVVNGQPGAFRRLGNVADGEGSVAFSTDNYTHKESQTGQRLEDLRLVKGKSASISLSLEDWSKENLALAFYGAASTVAADVVTGEPLTSPVAVGDIVRLSKRNVSSVVVKDSAGTPATLVAGTDYEVIDPKAGLVKILNLGSYTQPFAADFAYGAMDNVNIFTQPPQELWLMFSGKNTAAGDKAVVVELYRVIFDPLADLQMLHAEIGKLSLSGSVLYDATKASDAELGQFGRMMIEN